MPKNDTSLKVRLVECEKIISEAQIGAAKAKKALYTILKEQLWKAEFSSEAEYLKARGYTRGTISHIRSFVELVNDLEIPAEQCPSESAVRPLAKKAFVKDRGEIYQTACQLAEKRSGSSAAIPTLPDVKKAIREYCDNQSREIILRAIDEKVPADTDFVSGILGNAEISEKIKSPQQLLAVLRDFFRKRSTPENVRTATEEFLKKLRDRENKELENFFQKKSEYNQENVNVDE